MGRRIAFCADGTWDGVKNNTNVYRLYKAIIKIPGEQYSMYDDGVGADGNPIEKLLGGAFGTGLFQKIKEGYTSISNVYEAGDDVFIFGFSRGAYTARSLAGMIAACGLPTKNPDTKLVNTAFEAYRHKDQRATLLASLGDYGLVQAGITMLGVWDTVGALGIPAIIGASSMILYGFLDTGLHPDVLNAYHAVALDERRHEFPSTLWTGAPAAGQTISQVYFCGAHSDVGGGYGDDPGGVTALSDITLSWMMAKATALGLELDPGVLASNPCPMDAKYALDIKHESWNVGWLFPRSRTVAADATLANSVVIRGAEESSYRPPNLTFVNGVPAPGYGVEVVVKP